MSLSTLLLIALCGLATFLMRWIPLRRALQRQQAHEREPGARLPPAWLSAIGPAAIAALCALALRGVMAAPATGVAGGFSRWIAMLVGLAALALARRLSGGGIAIPTLAGAVAFGVAMQLLAL